MGDITDSDEEKSKKEKKVKEESPISSQEVVS